MTQRDKLIAALKARGETIVQAKSIRYVVMTRKAGGFYYLGASGACRFGRTVSESRPVNEGWKQQLLASAEIMRLVPEDIGL